MDNKLMDKMQKLLSLADSPNENEAKTAWKKLQKYLAEYNIELETIRQRERKSYVFEKQFLFYDLPTRKKALNWKRTLLGNIARANSCKVLFYGAFKAEIYGTEHDRTIVSYMFGQISVQCEFLAEQANTQQDRLHGATFKNNYLAGLVDEIYRILTSANDETTGYSIVKVKNTELIEWYDANKPDGVRSLKSSIKRDAQAYNAGRDAASRVNMGRGLTGSSQVRQLN